MHNASPVAKVPAYAKSKVAANFGLGQRIKESGFKKGDEAARTAQIVEYFKRRWPVP